MEFNFSLATIKDTALDCWKATGENKVLAFHGEMGIGKTTFIHALCDVKEVKDVVGSPTFSLNNEYAFVCEGTLKPLFHLDLYRVKDEKEAIDAGIEEVLNSGYTCLVEWPEKAPQLFPEDTIHIYMERVDNETRRLKIANK